MSGGSLETAGHTLLTCFGDSRFGKAPRPWLSIAGRGQDRSAVTHNPQGLLAVRFTFLLKNTNSQRAAYSVAFHG